MAHPRTREDEEAGTTIGDHIVLHPEVSMEGDIQDEIYCLGKFYGFFLLF